MGWLQLVIFKGLCLALQSCIVKPKLLQAFIGHWLTALALEPVTACFLIETLCLLVIQRTLHAICACNDHGRNVRVGIRAIDIVTVLWYVWQTCLAVLILAIGIYTVLPCFKLIVAVGCIFYLEEDNIVWQSVSNALGVAFNGKLRCVRVRCKVLAWSPCQRCAVSVTDTYTSSGVLNRVAVLVTLDFASISIEPCVRRCAHCLVSEHFRMQ